jgi:hypothetical protein
MRTYPGFSFALAVAVSLTACVDKSSLGDYDDGGDDASDSTDDGGTSTSAGDGDGSASGTGGGDDPEACALEPDPGPCEAAFMHWFFDLDDGQCKPFLYGGCEGVVPFATLADCEASCLACGAFDGSTGEPTPVEIVLENQTDETLYVDAFGGADPGCDGGFPFRVSSGDFYEQLDLIHGCRMSCSHAASFCEEPGCPAICETAPIVRLEPGGHHAMSWSGAIFRETRLPTSCAECDDVESPVLECIRPDLLEGGAMYYFESVAGDLACQGDACDGCEPGPDGSCLIEFGGEITPSTHASTFVSWGASPSIVITFE